MTKLEELWAAYLAELKKTQENSQRTKLEELKVACDAADDNCDAAETALDAAYEAACDAREDANSAHDAYQAELKKTKEQTND